MSDEARFLLPSAGTSAGVLMTEAEPGTPLARLTAVRPVASSRAAQASDSYAAGDGRMLITQINGQKVATLDDFVKAVKKVAPGSSGYAVARDLASASSSPSGRVVEINFNTGRYPLQVFTWDDKKLEWVDESGSTVAATGDAGAPAAAPATAAAKPKPSRTLLQASSTPAAKSEGAATGDGPDDAAAKPSTTKAAPELAASKPAAAASGLWSAADKARFRKGVVAVRRVTDVPLDDAARGDASHSGVVVHVGDDQVVIATAALTTNSPTTFDVTFYDGTTAKVRVFRVGRWWVIIFFFPHPPSLIPPPSSPHLPGSLALLGLRPVPGRRPQGRARRRGGPAPGVGHDGATGGQTAHAGRRRRRHVYRTRRHGPRAHVQPADQHSHRPQLALCARV